MANEKPSLEYLGQARLTASLEILSGLHIGAGKDSIEIGGIDQPVIKTPPQNPKPYVPGSSLKGKLRFLLEWAFGKINHEGKPWTGGTECSPSDPILRIFGVSAGAGDSEWRAGPTRLLMHDAMPMEEWINKGGALTEEKTEVIIDRIAGKALDKGLRRIERVPPEALFEFSAAFRLYAVESDGGRHDLDCLGWLIQGLDLLEQDALGGSGSRGYGRVRFKNLKLKFPSLDDICLDDIFRNHPFSRNEPPQDIMEKVNKVKDFLNGQRE